jgi:DNA-binding MarR family transcriptional regulator
LNEPPSGGLATKLAHADLSNRRLSERQRQVLLALHQSRALDRRGRRSVRSLVEAGLLDDSRFAGPLAALEESNLVAREMQVARNNWRSYSFWWLTEQGRTAAQSLERRPSESDQLAQTVPLLEADPTLGERLAGESRGKAGAQLRAELHQLEPGAWRPEVAQDDWRDGLGLLVLDGLLVREMRIMRRGSLELLGPGDLLRPWVYDLQLLPAVEPDVNWEVLTSAQLAVLDSRLAARMAAWPEVLGALLDRAIQRSRSLALQSAVREGGSVEDRLLLTLWHLVHRWGRVEGNQVLLPLPTLTPEVLARFTATSRSSVIRGLQRLTQRRIVERLEDGSWRLRRQRGLKVG